MPNGQIQLQKNRPSSNVGIRMISDQIRPWYSVCVARLVAMAMSGSISRYLLTQNLSAGASSRWLKVVTNTNVRKSAMKTT